MSASVGKRKRRRARAKRSVNASEGGREIDRRSPRFSEKLYTTLQDSVKHVRLRDQSAGTVSGAAASVSKRWNPNSAYTPIVGGSSSATPGFSEWAALYDYYRVMAYKVDIQVVNNEAIPVTVSLLNLTSDPGTAAALAYSSNRYCWSNVLPAKGGMDKWSHKQPLLTITQLVGSDQPIYDDAYRAPGNASPSIVTWFVLASTSLTGANLTNGISYKIDLEMFVDFFSPARNA
jgi:hypothetical protein